MSINKRVHDVLVALGFATEECPINIDGQSINGDYTDSIKLDFNVFGIHIKGDNTALSDDNPHICIGWHFLGDLTNFKTKEELRQHYENLDPNASANSIGANVGQIWLFKHGPKVGDYVIFGDNNIFHIGQIESDYYFDETLINGQDPKFVNNRRVKWLLKNQFKNVLSKKFQNSIGSAKTFFKLNDYKSAVIDLLNNRYSNDDETEDIITTYDFNTSSFTDAQNLIVYGTPGCGKSYYVEHTLTDGWKHKIRTTFYQDYTNTDFVGQILPMVDGDKVTYEFNPGPFTLALERAIANPEEKVALIIEELNRGSAASIFGDIFQLLDRDKNCVSVYPIQNMNIIKYLNKQFVDTFEFDEIRIPGNLSIFATMNTSDQNVFTLDTAFKRRWKFKKLNNKFEEDHLFKDFYVPGADVTWEYLVNQINEYMLETADSFNSEDKQIGVYFVDSKGMREKIDIKSDELDIEEFAYKFLEYLWDDVAKFHREKWFDSTIKSLDQLVEKYKTNGLKVFKEDVIHEKD